MAKKVNPDDLIGFEEVMDLLDAPSSKLLRKDSKKSNPADQDTNYELYNFLIIELDRINAIYNYYGKTSYNLIATSSSNAQYIEELKKSEEIKNNLIDTFISPTSPLSANMNEIFKKGFS